MSLTSSAKVASKAVCEVEASERTGKPRNERRRKSYESERRTSGAGFDETRNGLLDDSALSLSRSMDGASVRLDVLLDVLHRRAESLRDVQVRL